MTQWSVKPTWKKSIIERIYMSKDDNTVIVETGWRWGEFIVYTDDDTPPVLEAGIDLYDCDYEAEMVETTDGCWEEHDYDDCDDDTREWLEEFFDDGNSYYDLEEHGWEYGDSEMIIDCDMIIKRCDEEGNPTGEIKETAGDSQEITQEVKLVPGSEWPFPQATKNSDGDND
jgi:hypothetical protein